MGSALQLIPRNGKVPQFGTIEVKTSTRILTQLLFWDCILRGAKPDSARDTSTLVQRVMRDDGDGEFYTFQCGAKLCYSKVKKSFFIKTYAADGSDGEIVTSRIKLLEAIMQTNRRVVAYYKLANRGYPETDYPYLHCEVAHSKTPIPGSA